MKDADSRAIDFYTRMLRIRRFEERSLELSREGFVQGSIHLCLGQEAIPVGVSMALRPEDRVVGTYRGHGWALSCGVPVTELLAEVCQRRGGINGGRCGSALVNAIEHGFVGENSIVGAGAPIAAGIALAARGRGTGGVAAVSIGDGAMNQGSVHEALVFAGAFSLPLVVICENNGWSEMTPTAMTLRGAEFRERVAGYRIEARVVDGCDPAAVHESAEWALARARDGEGPVFLDCKTIRLGGHYNRDIEHYRSKDDRAEAQQRDPVRRLRERILADELLPVADLEALEQSVAREIDEATAAVRLMPEPDPRTATQHVDAPSPDGAGKEPTRTGTTVELTYQYAVNRALADELTSRDNLLVYGEDVGIAGGIFGVTRGLHKKFGPERVFDTPISESAILGSAVGAAIAGALPVVEVMWSDFLLVALDQLVNQAANVRYASRSQMSAPLVVRVQQGATPGSCAQHSQSLEALLAHIPGIKVGMAATSADAYAMTRAAVADPDPCVLIESRSLYQRKGAVQVDAPVEPARGARLRRAGSHALVISWGAVLHEVLEAADVLADGGVEVAVLDMRWLRPLDDEAIASLVPKTGGRVLIVHEANRTGGVGAEIAARIHEQLPEHLVQPVRRLGASDVRIPASPALQRAVLPNSETIAEAVREMLGKASEVAGAIG